MFFRKIDFISPEISLYYDNSKRHSSFFGGLLSLIFILNFLGILVQYSSFNTLPNKYSLNIYRNFDSNIKEEFFNENDLGIFHFLYLYNNNKLSNEDLIKYKNIKNGIIHVYMINLLNAYDFNSSNLHNYDHWVYDSCNNYALEEDEKYDFSYSYCIHYYYNSEHKKYYSINDKTNFKWPFFKESNLISDNSFFATFVEKCSNNSFINNILGKCYSEEKINNFLEIFNSIFISFIDNKIQISDEKNPIKKYSHQIHNRLKNDGSYYSFHEMEFMKFNYEENGVFYKKLKINSFLLEDDKIYKVYKNIKNDILALYSFRFKNYYDVYRKIEHKFFTIFRLIFSNIIAVYFIFYLINLLFNEMTQTKDFISFINDNNDTIIQKRINYDKNKFFSLKSVLNSNESNDNINNNQFNSLHSSYFGNVKTNNMSSNFLTSFNKDNNSKFNKKSEMIYLGEKEENNFSKKSENIVFINNGTFMDANLNNKNKLNFHFNIFEKTKSMKIDNKNNDFNNLEQDNKIYSYRKNEKETDIYDNNIHILNKNGKNKTSENTIDNDSKRKINMNNSSISLLKENNVQKNISSNHIRRKELLPINKDKKYSIYSPHNSPFSNNNIKSLYKNKESTNDLINSNIDNKKYSVSTIYNTKNLVFDKDKNKFNISFIKSNNKSHEKNKNHDKTNLEPFHQDKRKKSLSNEYNEDNNSQISLSKKLKDNKKNSQHNKLMGTKINKEKIRQEHEEHYKKKRTDAQNSLNAIHTPKNRSRKSFNFEKDGILTTEVFVNYLCFWKKNKYNGINMMYNFRKRLLSEENLYLSQLNLLIFKKKLGCKTTLDLKSLMEELYYDY